MNKWLERNMDALPKTAYLPEKPLNDAWSEAECFVLNKSENNLGVDRYRFYAWWEEGRVLAMKKVMVENALRITPIGLSLAIVNTLSYAQPNTGLEIPSDLWPKTYLWAPHGFESVQDDEAVKVLEPGLIHFKHGAGKFWIFKVRKPGAGLLTFYPERWSEMAFMQHPSKWYIYTESYGVARLGDGNFRYTWGTTLPTDQSKSFLDLLQLRIAKTLKRSHQVFTEMAIGVDT